MESVASLFKAAFENFLDMKQVGSMDTLFVTLWAYEQNLRPFLNAIFVTIYSKQRKKGNEVINFSKHFWYFNSLLN